MHMHSTLYMLFLHAHIPEGITPLSIQLSVCGARSQAPPTAAVELSLRLGFWLFPHQLHGWPAWVSAVSLMLCEGMLTSGRIVGALAIVGSSGKFLHLL